MNLNELKNLVGNVTKALYENEKLPAPILAVRARKEAERHPQDQTLVAMANFLTQRATKSTFISRKELKQAYTKLYSPNNKFASLFADEIGSTELKGAKYATHSEYENTPISVDYGRTADSLLSNALNAAFDKDASYKPYSNETAVKAEKACAAELNGIGVPPKRISVFAGNSDILICDAVYETPKGQSHVLVPVEIVKENALLPTIFLSKVGFSDLSKNDLEDHIVTTAGKSYHVDGKKVLEILSTAKFGSKKEPTSKVALAVMKLRASKETPANYTAEGIVYQQVDQPIEDVVVEKSAEVETFAQKLASAKGTAEFVLGAENVKKAQGMLKTKLAGFGYKHPQISVDGVKDNLVVFAVAVDGLIGFKVPVQVEGGRIQEPRFAISAGSAYSFSKQGIGNILAANQVDARMLANASPMKGMRSGELVEQIREAMADDNYLKAEEALNVLKQEHGEEVYARGFAIYMEGFNKQAMVKEASINKCSMVLDNKNSKHQICGHTGLPLHKVYQDAHGDCQPLYRKAMQYDEEGGAFMAHKVFI